MLSHKLLAEQFDVRYEQATYVYEERPYVYNDKARTVRSISIYIKWVTPRLPDWPCLNSGFQVS